MFYIHSIQLNKDFCKEEKIILFNYQEEAAAFADAFLQYAMVRMLRENPFNCGEIFSEINGGIEIIPIDDKAPNFNAEKYIKFDLLKK